MEQSRNEYILNKCINNPRIIQWLDKLYSKNQKGFKGWANEGDNSYFRIQNFTPNSMFADETIILNLYLTSNGIIKRIYLRQTSNNNEIDLPGNYPLFGMNFNFNIQGLTSDSYDIIIIDNYNNKIKSFSNFNIILPVMASISNISPLTIF